MRTLRKLLTTLLVLLALVAPVATVAAGDADLDKVAGTWCQVVDEDATGGWTFFVRHRGPGKDCGDEVKTLFLKKNGDYVLGGIGDDLVCKAVPKTRDFKGWTDYNCTHEGAKTIKLPTTNEKFLLLNKGRLGHAQ